MPSNASLPELPYYRFRSDVVTPPAVPVVTLEEAKAYLAITGTDDDALITSLITSATQLSEEYCKRKFINTAMLAQADDDLYFKPWWRGVRQGAFAMLSTWRSFTLPWLALFSVESVKVMSRSGVETTIDPTGYIVDTSSKNRPGRIVLKLETVISVDPAECNALRVAYTAGYGAVASNVPESIKLGIKNMITYMYNHRGECGGDVVKDSGAGPLFNPYRLLQV